MANVALFVDVDDLHQRLRAVHNRSLDPRLLLEAARARGEVVRAGAIADWEELPESLTKRFEGLDFERVQAGRSQRRDGAKRRDVVRDVADLELLAQIVETLFSDGGPEVDVFVLGTTSPVARRAVSIARERFQKEVVVVGVEGVSDDGLAEAAAAWEPLPMPPVEPEDAESLTELVPLLEDLERRKRYLNFKYIRETVVRRLEAAGRSFERAEEILSDAIACGVLLKRKIDDKYNPGQLFTAYSLDRGSPWFEKWGSGDPAPEHDDEAPEAAEAPKAKRGRGRGKPEAADDEGEPEAAREEQPRGRGRGRDRDRDSQRDSQRDDEGGGRGRKRRRRRRGSSSSSPPGNSEGIQLSAGSQGGGNKKKRRSKGGGRNHQQDRVGRAYEAPSRFLSDEEERPIVRDDEIDEDRILRARGDL